MTNKTPTQNMIDMETVLTALETLAPEKTFGGFTVEQYHALVQMSRDEREEVAEAETILDEKINKRNKGDVRTLTARELIINGIIGDPEFGPDSMLYQACGFVRKSARKSGLTRKKKVQDDNG